jgi:hypothetical protein
MSNPRNYFPIEGDNRAIADPWAGYAVVKPEIPPDAPFRAYAGQMPPFSIDENGRMRFDSDADIPGGLKRAVAAPGEVYSGVTPQASPEARSKAYTGDILPFSIDENGKGRFDSDAGIVGAAKRAFMTPGDVYSRKIDLNTPEGFARAQELARFLNPVSPAVRASRLGVVAPKVKAPTAEALKAAADEGYGAVWEMGVDYATPAVTKMVGGFRTALEKDGTLAEFAPKTEAILRRLANPPAGSVVSTEGLAAARRAAEYVAKDSAERTAANRLIEEIDSFIASADPRSVVAGPAADAAETIAKARANAAAHQRSAAITGQEGRADLRAATTAPDPKLDLTIRQRAASVIENPELAQGFTPEELARLERLVLGGRLRNGLRSVNNRLDNSGGFGSVIAAGGGLGVLTGNPTLMAIGSTAAAAAPGVGTLAKLGQNILGRRALNAADEATRQRSPLYADIKAAAPMEPSSMLGSQAILGLGTSTLLRPPATPQGESQEEQLLRHLREGGA